MSELVLVGVAKATPNVDLASRSNIPHHRFLRLEWRDGKAAEIRFDQGLSGMQVARRAYSFDTGRPPARQAAELARLAVEIEAHASGAAPIYVFGPG